MGMGNIDGKLSAFVTWQTIEGRGVGAHQSALMSVFD